MNSVKYCPECNEPIVGRRDKTFCSSSCKSKDFRRKAEKEEVIPFRMMPVLPVPLAAPKPPVLLVEEEEDEQEEQENYWDKQNRIRQEEKHAQELREQSSSLHKVYCQLVEEFLNSEGAMIKEEAVHIFLEELSDATQEYRGHPGLVAPEHISHQRLADLYWMRDTLREVLDYIAQQGFLTSKSSRFDLGKKKRNRLRNHLLE